MMGQGATTGQRLTKLKKQGTKAAGSAAASSGLYVAASGLGASTTTPAPPPAAMPGCAGLIAALIAALASLVGVSRRELALMLSPDIRQSTQASASAGGYSAEEAARMSDDTRMRVRAVIQQINTAVASPDGGELPTSSDFFSLARTLHGERVYGLAIEMAKQAPHLIAPDAAPVEYFRAERDSHLMLYEIYRDRGETEASDFHEAQFFRFDAGVNQLITSENP